MDKQIKIKLNAPLLSHKIGTILTLQCDADGVPYNAFWRRRLADAPLDNCVEVVNEDADAQVTKILTKKDKSL